MAPEIEAHGKREPYWGWAADMWAYACMAFELLEGKPAFRGASNQQLAMRIVRVSHEASTPQDSIRLWSLMLSTSSLHPQGSAW